ncbi:MAG: DUF4386 domain-containing protein [Spirochaetales bacterium]|nr:DUF4386 domain-containing protein [Spirochaetales bacterium]
MNDIERKKRNAGILFLAYFAATILSDNLGHFGLSPEERVYETLVGNPRLYELGLTVLLISILLFFLTARALYLLLKSEGKERAQVFLLLNGIGTAVHFSSVLLLIAASYTGESTSLMLIILYKRGFAMIQLFFGLWLFPLGLLVYKSVHLPRLLGVLLILDGIGILFWFLQSFLFPEQHTLIIPGLFISFTAEFSLALYLVLPKGIRLRPSSPGSSRNSPRKSS